MTEVIDRRYLLYQKYLRLKKKYGHDHAINSFSQREQDDMFHYVFISCRTVDNLRKAEELGYEIGSHVVPENLEGV